MKNRGKEFSFIGGVSELSPEEMAFCINKIQWQIINEAQKQTELGQRLLSELRCKSDRIEVFNGVALKYRTYDKNTSINNMLCSECKVLINVHEMHIAGTSYYPGSSAFIRIVNFCNITCLRSWMKKPPIKRKGGIHQTVFIPISPDTMRIAQAVDDAARQILDRDAIDPRIIDQIMRNCFGSMYNSVPDAYEQVFYRLKEISRDE